MAKLIGVLMALILVSVMVPSVMAIKIYQPEKHLVKSPIAHEYPYMTCGYKTLSVQRNQRVDMLKAVYMNEKVDMLISRTPNCLRTPVLSVGCVVCGC